MKNVILLFVVFNFSLTANAQIVLDGLQSYYTFNSAMITDHSGNDLDGTGHDIVSTIGLEDTLNSAYAFNGFSSYIDLGTDNRNITNQVSLSLWIKTTTDENQIFTSKYNWVEDKGYFMRINDGLVSFGGRDNNDEFIEVVSTSAVNDGEWHHVMGIIDVNEWSIYVDCIKENETSTSSVDPVLTTDDALAVGYLSVPTGDGNHRHFNGDVDEVRVYNRPLSELEVDSLCQLEYIITNVYEFTTQEQFEIFPVPANDILFLKAKPETENPGLLFEIVSLDGRLIKKGTINNNDVNIGDLADGLYFLILKNESHIPLGMYKFIKS